MAAKTISICQGKGSLSHNNRGFSAKNVDRSRTADNIVFVRQDLGTVYTELFGAATARYNARQKRNDRRVPDYFHHLFGRAPSASVITGTNKQKSFYEELVQIGTREDTGIGTPDAEEAVRILREYMIGFQERNPNFYVFNAVLHLDEATPHIHIDYIPVGHFKNGIDTRNAMAKALEEMGYGKGADAINRWRMAEREILQQICAEHGIEIAAPQKSRGYSYTVAEYGEHLDKIRALTEEEAQLSAACSETRAELAQVAAKKTKIDTIERIETGKTVFGGKVTIAKADWETVSTLAKKQIAAERQTRQLKTENQALQQKIAELERQIAALTAERDELKKEFTLNPRKLLEAAKLKAELHRLRKAYNTAMAIIAAHKLLEEYYQSHSQTQSQDNVLE